MKKTIKKILVKILNPLVIKIGYVKKNNVKIIEVNAHDKNSLLKSFFTSIKETGFDPKHIIDVGANHGTWTRETLYYFPNACYTLLEPQNWLQSSFQDLLDRNKKIKYYPYGAGSKEETLSFTLSERDDSSTFKYTKEEAIKLGYKQIDVPVVTLNSLIEKETEFPFPDIVKIDAEGLDLEVLKGANSLFGKTEVFMVEAGVVHKGFENSFLNLINFMDENGYILFDITDLNRPFTPNVLWLVELAFVKKQGIIDSYTFI